MDWNAPTLWWLAAGVLVAAELATGTFYLLMLALGTAAGALAAHLGLGQAGQWVVAAVVAAGATAAWHLKRASAPRSAPAANNQDVNLDIGAAVQVEAWQPDGSARVAYRGTTWAVRYAGQGEPSPGRHVIVSVQSGWLGVSPAPSQ
jgi:membrane protein implicated in regulation of membrane protease activity